MLIVVDSLADNEVAVREIIDPPTDFPVHLRKVFEKDIIDHCLEKAESLPPGMSQSGVRWLGSSATNDFTFWAGPDCTIAEACDPEFFGFVANKWNTNLVYYVSEQRGGPGNPVGTTWRFKSFMFYFPLDPFDPFSRAGNLESHIRMVVFDDDKRADVLRLLRDHKTLDELDVLNPVRIKFHYDDDGILVTPGRPKPNWKQWIENRDRAKQALPSPSTPDPNSPPPPSTPQPSAESLQPIPTPSTTGASGEQRRMGTEQKGDVFS